MYAVIDVETTGGSPVTDRVIEIAIIICDGEQILHQYTSLVNPNRPIDKYVTQLTGITDKMVRTAPTFDQIGEEVWQLTEGNIFVAHNVKFDYGMLRSEFKRMGRDFIRKQLDTITLAQKVLPGFTSYSLGSLCDSLGIKIANRHRALGDAEATVKLLHMILHEATSPKYIEIELNHGLDVATLPPNIGLGDIEQLPEEPGVFYLKDQDDRIIFIDSSKNVRKEVVKLLSRTDKTPEWQLALPTLTQIDYVASGHELISRLMAHHEMRKHQPPLNKKQKEYKHTHAIYLVPDDEGFLQLRMDKIDLPDAEPALRFQGKSSAQKVHAKIIAESHLQVQFSLLRKMTDETQRQNFKKSYNEKVARAVERYLYKASNFFILTEGRRPDEHSVIWIENSIYKGVGYISPELNPINTENLKAAIKPYPEDMEIQKIIRQEMRKGKGMKVIPY
jgi:DNA polymerase III subunit epsilon